MSHRFHDTVRLHMRGRRLRRGPARPLLLLPIATLLSGCYSYRVIEPHVVAPGEEIRVIVRDVSRYARTRTDALLKRSTDPTFELEGKLVRLTPDSLALSVWIGRDYVGTPFETVREEVAFPRSDIVRVERRAFSRGRTALLALGTTATILFLIDRIGVVEIVGGSGDDGPPLPPIQEVVVPR